MRKHHICVVGLGYIGLPTASLLATKGFTVVGCDSNSNIVKTINQGQIHIVEPELDILVKSAVHSGQLKASEKPEPADVFIIAVPTPFKGNYEPDLSYVRQAVKSISGLVKCGDTIILESTSPVGTTDQIATWLKKERGHVDDLFLAHCPERVLPGSILRELVENDRLVGGLTPEATQKVAEFYGSFVSGKILKTDAKTAEMAKLVENSYRDVNIAFANELSMICDDFGIDIWELIQLANHHPRVNILNPGPGVGGHCIAVDPWFIVNGCQKKSILIKTARQVNDSKPKWVMEKIRQKAKQFNKPVIGCLGLSYKNDIDDLRESPSLKILKSIHQEGIGRVIACEPNLLTTEIEGIPLFSVNDLVEQADIVVILVNHKEFLNLDADTFDGKIVVDTQGLIC